jgi:hypothetical protein
MKRGSSQRRAKRFEVPEGAVAARSLTWMTSRRSTDVPCCIIDGEAGCKTIFRKLAAAAGRIISSGQACAPSLRRSGARYQQPGVGREKGIKRLRRAAPPQRNRKRGR